MNNGTTPLADDKVPAINGRNPGTLKALRAALELLFVGDALSMPVHWYYRPGDILRAFGKQGVTRMEAAPLNHPSSIMSLHSTRSGGRSAVSPRAGKAPEIIGDVILKGRRHLWDEAGRHYHHGMPAGENTLNAWCARWLLEHLANQGEYRADAWIADYIERMTADPPVHPDSYAESYHRGFFANLAAGRSPTQSGAVTHDTPSMGALVTVAPLALSLLASEPVSAAQRVCREHVWFTHPDEMLMTVVDAYVALLAELVELAAEGPDESSGQGTGASPSRSGEEALAEARRDAIVRAASVIPGTRLASLLDKAPDDARVVGGQYSLACYITDSWPSVCWLAARYLAEPGKALCINTNLGGENAHRGAVLGTLVGAASGRSDPVLFDQLHRRDELNSVIDAWMDLFTG